MKKVRKLLGLLLVLAWSTCLYAQKQETPLLQVQGESYFSKTTEVLKLKSEQKMLSSNGQSAVPIRQSLKELDYNSKLSYIKEKGIDIKAESSGYIPTFYGGAVGQTLIKLKLEQNATGTDTVGFTIADCPFAGPQTSLGGYVYPIWATWVKGKYIGYWGLKKGASTYLYNYMAWDPNSDNPNGEVIGDGKLGLAAGKEGFKNWNQANGAAYSKTKDSIYLIVVQYNAAFTVVENIILGITSGRDGVVNQLGNITGLPSGDGIVSLACANNGTLYTITFSGDLYSIESTTLAATKIGATGYTSDSYAQSMAVDPKTDKLYWAGVIIENTQPAPSFFEVNTSTGAATLIKGGIPQTSGLASNYSNPDILNPTVFTATISDTNYLKVDIKIILPTKDINGDLITTENAPAAVIIYEKTPSSDWALKERITANVDTGATIEASYTNMADGEYGYAVVIESKTGATGNRLEQYVYCMNVELPYNNGFEDAETAAQKNLITTGTASLKTESADAHVGTNSYYLKTDGYIEIKGIPVEKGGTYKVSLWSKTAVNQAWLYVGNSNSAEIPHYTYAKLNVYQQFNHVFIAKESGQESIKIYVDYSGDDAYIDDIKIEMLASGSVPNVPTDISVKAAENGAKRALLSFTNPSITMGDDELSALSGIIVYYGTSNRFPFGEDTVHITTTEAGKEMINVEIEVLKNAKYYFGLVSFNEQGECPSYAAPAQNGLYIGTDIPSTPQTLKAEIEEGKLKLIWNKVTTGINNAYIPERGMQYLLTYKHGTIIDSVDLIADTTHTFETLPLDHYYFEVKAVVENMYSLAQKTYKTFGMAANQVVLAEATKTGSSSGTFPLLMSATTSTAKSSAITQSIYQPTDSAMYITKLNLLTTTTTSDISQRYVVYMGYKDSNAFANTKDWVQPEDLSKVFDGELVSNSATAVTQIPISGFYYDGQQPLLVYIVKPSRESNAAAWNTYTSLTADENKWGSLYKSSSSVNFDTIKDLSEHTSLLTAGPGGYVPALLVDKLATPSTVKGKIINGLGDALVGVIIKINQAESNNTTINAEVKTDESGNYEFTFMPTGDYTLTMSALGYLDIVSNINIATDGSTVVKDITMQTASKISITGKVVDAGNKPMAGISVKASTTTELTVVTGEDGAFIFEDVYGSTIYKFKVEKEGLKKYESTIKIGEKDTTLSNFIMEYIPLDMLSVSAVVNASKAAEVKWTKPGKSEIKTWNSPNDTIGMILTNDGAAISFAHRYLASDLASMVGKKIIKAGFVPSDPTAKYTLRICADTNTELYKKELKTSALTIDKWNDISISSDVNIPQGKELWIIFDVAEGYKNHPIAFGQSTAIANKGDLLGVGGKWMRASSATTIKTNVLIKFAVQTVEGSDAPNGYIVYRGKSDAEFSAYTKVSETNVSGNTYTDASYASIGHGIYRYAVCADYYQESPVPVYSDVLVKDMEYKVDLNIKAAGGSVAKGASLTMVNKADPSYTYTAKSDSTGKISIPIVWRGTYAVNVSLPYHQTIKEDWVVESNISKDIQLVDVIGDPYIISVNVNGNEATMDFSANNIAGWTDGAEAYEDFAIDSIGEWIMANKTKKGGIEDCDWKNSNESQAFIVFDNKKTSPALPTVWAAHQGDKYFASFFSSLPANKDMMIRSVLEGGGTLSFYQFGAGYDGAAEKYQVLYSTTNTTPSSFTPVGGAGTKDIEATSKWEKVSFNIPQTAKYIAIQYKSNDLFAFGVDDISYRLGEEVKPKSFELYVDGSKVGEAKAMETQYVFKNLSAGEHVLGIKSIFASGESKLITQTIKVSSTPKPVDLKVDVQKEKATATFTFKAPSGFTPKSYKVYLGNEMKAENLTEMSYTFTNLAEGSYVAGVIAVYAEGESEMATLDFKVEGVASEGSELAIKAMLYPNPSRNGIYTLYIGEKANIEIIDFGGKLVYKLNNVQEGKTTLDLSSKSGGIYYVRIKTNDAVKTIKAIRE